MNLQPADAALVLRDIHQPPAPPWWPPAPGWWVLGCVLLASVLALAWWGWRRHRRRRALQRLFDDSVAGASTPAQQVGVMSALLRRAVLRRDPRAAALQGDDWLRYLDRDAGAVLFDGEYGQLLLDGGFRDDVEPAAVAALRPRARQRFLQWMGAR